MDKLIQQYPEYEGYIISQLDPFHDQSYELGGAPSSNLTNTVILKTRREMSIGYDSFGTPAPGGKFDINFASFPTHKVLNYYGVNHSSNCLLTRTGAYTESDYYRNFGPVTVSGRASGLGNRTFVADSSIPVFSTLPDSTVDDPLKYTPPGGLGTDFRTARLIGQAFEVVDETPEFYSQGSCTVYKVPASHSFTPYMVNVTDGTNTIKTFGTEFVHSFPAPPNTLEEAVKLPGSRTWKAREGAYVVSEKCCTEIPFIRPGFASNVILGDIDSSASTVENKTWITASAVSNGQEIATKTQKPPYPVALDGGTLWPYHLSGAYFTGLSQEYASLRLRLIQIWEVAPRPEDESLIPLAKPTLPLRVELEMMLQQVKLQEPSGYMQSMNPKGEVWRNIGRITAKILKNGAVPLMMSINQPQLAALASAGGEVLESVSKKKKPKKSKIQQPQASGGSKPKIVVKKS